MDYLFRARSRAAAAALFVALAACSRAAAVDPEALQQLREARRRSHEALASAGELERHVARLEMDLRAERRARRRLETRIGAVAGDARGLRAALVDVRGHLSRLEPARASAAAAVARADALARELAVLDKRLDYHLSEHRGPR